MTIRGLSQKQLVVGAIVALVLFLFAFVWPTPYHYAVYHSVPVRISRFTGRAEILTPNGWHLMMTPAPTRGLYDDLIPPKRP